MTSPNLSLICVFNKETRPFSIRISSSKTVDELRLAIKVQQSTFLRNVDANYLTLWLVALPVPPVGNPTKIVLNENIQATELDPFVKLSDVFDQAPPDRTISIIVQRLVEQGSPMSIDDLGVPHSAPPVSDSELAFSLFQAQVSDIVRGWLVENTNVAAFIDAFIRNEIQLPFAENCAFRGLPKRWVRNRANDYSQNRPALYLLHPTRTHPTREKNTSVQALELIQKHEYLNFLAFFGASGSGKTRAAIEMLSRTPGIYFNASSTDRGAGDMEALAYRAATAKKRYFSNRDAVRCLTACLSLSRLLILKHMSEHPSWGSLSAERLMLFQVCPGVFPGFNDDIFNNIFGEIARAYERLSERIHLLDLFEETQKNFKEVQKKIAELSGTLSGKVLVVLDEAQVLADDKYGSFLSSDGISTRTMLSPITNALEESFEMPGSQYKSGFCLVTSGTGLSGEDIGFPHGSSSQAGHGFEHVDARVVDFPGLEQREDIYEYLKDVSLCLDYTEVEKFWSIFTDKVIDLLYLKLRGRPRPIVSAVESILAGVPPMDAVAETITSLTNPEVGVVQRGNIIADIRRMFFKLGEDKKLAELEEMRVTLRETAFSWTCFGLPWTKPGEKPIYIEAAFARLRYETDYSMRYRDLQTTVTEPWVIQGVINYVLHDDPEFCKYFRLMYASVTDDQAIGTLSERQQPLSLVKMIHGQPLKRIMFKVPLAYKPRKPDNVVIDFGKPVFPSDLFDYKASVIGWTGQAWGQSFATISIKEFMDAHFYHDSMRRDANGDEIPVSAFFYPPKTPSGPDIVFVIELNGVKFPVFVQAKLVQSFCPKEVQEARTTISTDKILNILPNLDEYCPSKTFLSMLVCLPAVVSGSQRDWDNHDYGPPVRELQETTTETAEWNVLFAIIDGETGLGLFPSEITDLYTAIKRRPEGSDNSVEEDLCSSESGAGSSRGKPRKRGRTGAKRKRSI